MSVEAWSLLGSLPCPLAAGLRMFSGVWAGLDIYGRACNLVFAILEVPSSRELFLFKVSFEGGIGSVSVAVKLSVGSHSIENRGDFFFGFI